MSERKLNINGTLVPESRAGLSVNNRAFRYGDGLFESIRLIKGRALFLEDHFSRLKRSMEELKYEVDSTWSFKFFREEINKVLEINNIKSGGRLRFTVFRVGEGLYTPGSGEPGFVIDFKIGEPNSFVLNKEGINLGLYKSVKIPVNGFSFIKSNNCLPYIMAGIYAREESYGDVIILNEKGNVCEAISSNVFFLIDGILYTPSLDEGCVSGIMRKKVIQISKKMNIPVVESSISTDLLEDASEVLLTNAIGGLKWVQAYGKKRYFKKTCEKILESLNEVVARD